MPMARHPIGLEVIRRLGEQGMHFGLAPRAGNTGFGIGDQMRAIDHPRFDQRQEAQLHGGGIAARVSDQTRALDFFAVDFRQAIHGLTHQLGAGVRHAIPFLPGGHIRDTEICGKIDYAHPRFEQLARLRHGNAVGRGEKHHVALLEGGGGRGFKRQLHPPAQIGEHV